MYERFLAFIRELTGDRERAGPTADDPAVAAAALLFHVMDADGVRAEAERATLERELAAEYGLDGDRLRAILAAGEAAERDSVDLYQFTSVLMPALDQQARVDLVGMMWEIVYADSVRHEVEDNVVWRIAELLAVERGDRIRMRRAVEARTGAGAETHEDTETD